MLVCVSRRVDRDGWVEIYGGGRCTFCILYEKCTIDVWLGG